MKVLIYADNHFCESYSIVKKLGEKYTVRLENQIESINWVESEAVEKGCEEIICLGDFFDKPNLTEKEITALQDIKWSNLPHKFIVGNHESSDNGLRFSSSKALEGFFPGSVVFNYFSEKVGSTEICYLPYIIEGNRKSINEYFGNKTGKRIILSHNDVKGVQMGPVVSKTGVDLDDITANCDLFINGHLHNGYEMIKGKAINLGNLTGKDFGEETARCGHKIMILDTDSLTYQYEENPYALNFYKLEINTKDDLSKLDIESNNLVLSIKCTDELSEEVKNILKEKTNILEARTIVIHTSTNEETLADISELHVDSLKKFYDFCLMKLSTVNASVLQEELNEICKQ